VDRKAFPENTETEPPAAHAIPRFTSHFCKYLIGEGIPTADVQKLARHASYQTTIDVYRHLLPDELEKGLNHLDLLLESIEKTWKNGQGTKAL
jgi:hypothetical protein